MANHFFKDGHLPKCSDSGDITFCLFKPETYLLSKQNQILKDMTDAGLKVVSQHQIKLTFRDLFRMYRSTKARVTMSIRLPHLMNLDLFIVEGENAINTLHSLKYQIRRDLLGWNIGGFLHAPDSIEEFKAHMNIFSNLKNNKATTAENSI